MGQHGEYAYGMWVVVAFNVGIFLFFIFSFLRPTAGIEWRNMSVVTAFLVALFAEMYGFPLTIFMLTSWLGDAYPVLQPFSHKFGHLSVVVLGGSNLAWAVVMAVSLVLMIMGYILLSRGWAQIHAAHGGLVTDGIYAYARHPQYTGLFLVIGGFLVQWPTLLTVLMAPWLVYAYIRLAQFEERRVMTEFGADYTAYRQRTPAFFPPLQQWPAFLAAKPQGTAA